MFISFVLLVTQYIGIFRSMPGRVFYSEFTIMGRSHGGIQPRVFKWTGKLYTRNDGMLRIKHIVCLRSVIVLQESIYNYHTIMICVMMILFRGK